MPSPLILPFPRKGVNRNSARSDQTPDTAWDALNVVPYDRFDRPRGGQRSGTSKLYSSALCSSQVSLLAGVTTALDTSTLAPDLNVITENFAYSNGALYTVSSGVWATKDTSGNVNTAVSNSTLTSTDTAGLNVSSNQVQNNLASNVSVALYAGGLTLPTAYSVKVTYTNVALNDQLGLVLRRNPSAAVNEKFFLVFFNNNNTASNVTLIQDFATTRGSSTVATTTGTVVLEARVSGSSFSVYVNSVLQFTVAGVTEGTNAAIGFTQKNGNVGKVSKFEVFTLAPRASARKNNIIAVCGGSIYLGDSTSSALATSGSGVLVSAVIPQASYSQGNVYFVDGTSTLKLTISTSTVSTLTATAGSIPTGCTVTAVYRDRLVLAAPASAPQNFFLSRIGTHTDFDYSQTDTAAAFAGNASTAGRIGEPIVALMPSSDDIMFVGGDHSMWAIRGDPADGGSIDLVSDSIGVLGPNAWTKSPDGTIYFVGTQGLYRIGAGGGVPELLSDENYNQFFASINRATQYALMLWDRDRHGAYVFITPAVTGTATHLYWDDRNKGFWPVQFPDNHGPLSVLTYDGDAPTDRVSLLGGRNGYVQKLGSSYVTDDGTAISAYVTLGPIQPAPPAGDAIVTGMDVTLGEKYTNSDTFNVSWKLSGGKTAYEVTEGTPRRIAGGTFTTTGKQLSRVTRIRGGWFSLKFSNAVSGSYFALERAVLHVEAAGKQR